MCPWYLIEYNLGISEKLYRYITDTYSNNGKNIISFDREGNYTKITMFATDQSEIDTIQSDIGQRLVEVSEILSKITIMKTHKYNVIGKVIVFKTHSYNMEA